MQFYGITVKATGRDAKRRVVVGGVKGFTLWPNMHGGVCRATRKFVGGGAERARSWVAARCRRLVECDPWGGGRSGMAVQGLKTGAGLGRGAFANQSHSVGCSIGLQAALYATFDDRGTGSARRRCSCTEGGRRPLRSTRPRPSPRTRSTTVGFAAPRSANQ